MSNFPGGRVQPPYGPEVVAGGPAVSRTERRDAQEALLAELGKLDRLLTTAAQEQQLWRVEAAFAERLTLERFPTLLEGALLVHNKPGGGYALVLPDGRFGEACYTTDSLTLERFPT